MKFNKNFTRARRSKYIGHFKAGMIFGNWRITSSVVWRNASDGRYYVKCLCLRCNGTRQYLRIQELLAQRIRSCKNCYQITLPNIGPFPGWLINRWKHGAETRSLEWSISNDYLLNLYNEQSGRCALSGEELFFPSRKVPGNISLDRKDSSLGYINDNVQFVTKSINFAKQSSSQTEFIEMCRKVIQYNQNDV